MKFRYKAAAFISSAIMALSAGAINAAAADSSASVAEINSTNFPDDTFRNYVSEKFDSNQDGSLSQAECLNVTSIEVEGSISSMVYSLKGIELFPNLSDLYCSYNEITSIDVSKNTALTRLTCFSNQLTSLDVSNNTALKYLECGVNQLTSLDVSNCTALTGLGCASNQLTSLDVSNNTSLTNLYCHGNQLTSLDVSNNTALKYLECGVNQLTSLDVSNNIALKYFNSSDNSYSIVSILDTYSLSNLPGNFDPSKASNWQGAEFDSTNSSLKNITSDTVTYDYDCGNGKSEKFTLIIEANQVVEISEANFPDSYFRQYVSGNFDSNNDGWISDEECLKITRINVAGSVNSKGNIVSLKGIEYFTNLTWLNCADNRITDLDVSRNTSLTSLFCYGNQLTSLDVSNNTALDSLSCYDNQLTCLDVSNNSALTNLSCSKNQLTSLDVSNNSALIFSSLDCSGNTYSIGTVIDSYSLSNLPGSFDPSKASNWKGAEYDSDSRSLTNFTSGTITYDYDCGNGNNASFKLTLVDTQVYEINETYFPDESFRNYVSNEIDLDKDGWISQEEYFKVTSIDVSGSYSSKGNVISLKGIELFPNLSRINCENNKISSIDVSKNAALKSLDCNNNKLTSLDISKNTALTSLNCSNNQLTNINVSNCSSISLNCSSNTYSIGKVVGFYSLSNLPGSFDPSKASEWQGAKYDENTNSLISFTSDTVTYKYDCGNNYTVTFTLEVPEYIKFKGTLTFGDKIGVTSTEQEYSSGDKVEYDTEIWIGMGIDDYVNNRVLINGIETDLSDDGSGYWYSTSYTVNSDVNIQVVPGAWSAERLAKYVTLNADENVIVWYYNSSTELIAWNDRPIPNGGYIGKEKQVCIEIPSSEYPVKPNVYINDKFVDCSLNNAGMWQIWAYDVPDDADKLNISVKIKSISLDETVYAYYEDSTGNSGDLTNNSAILPEYSTIYVHADIDDYVDHALYVNGRELALTQTGDGYHFYGTIEDPFSYEKLEVKLVEKAWTDTELAKYVRVYADKGINVYHYNSYYGEAKINYNVPNGGYFSKNEAIVIRVNAALFPHAGFLYINGYPVKCSLNSDNQWQIWAYEIPDDAEKLNISFKGKSVSLGEKIYAYYEDNTGNVDNLPSDSIIYPEYSAIYVHVDIDDYVDHVLYVNDKELALTQTGDGYHFFGIIENPFSYDKLEVKLVEKAWTDTELTNYLRVYADEGIDVYHYNSYYGEVKINYSVPNGGYFTKDEAIVIRADADKYPNAGTLYINGQPIQCSLNDDNQWQIWANEIHDDLQKLTISYKGKEISLSDKVYAYYQDNRENINDFPNGSTILPEHSAIYLHVDIDDYVDHALLVNDQELSLIQTGDGYHFFGTIENPFSYDKLEVKLVEKAWTDTELANYLCVYADEGIDVYHYNSYYGVAKINYTVPVGGYFTKNEAIVIRADAAEYPNAGTLYINGQPVRCSLNSDNQWQIWAYEIPDDVQRLTISFRGKEISLSDKIYAYYQDNRGNITALPNGSTILPEYSAIYLHVDIDDYVDHALYVNDTELSLIQTGDGYHFFGTIENPFSYDKLEVKLVEKAWTDTELAKYVRVYADEGIDVYHYNSYYGEAKTNYTVPSGGYFTKDEAIVIRADAAKYPNAGTLYINGKSVQCTLNDDNQWQIWAYEIPNDLDVLKISFTGSEEICDVITGVTVTEKYVTVTYSNADKTASDTKTLAFDEVDVTIVDFMNKTDIRLVIDFVNAFSNSEADTIILTEAQLHAIEYVLAYDYAK